MMDLTPAVRIFIQTVVYTLFGLVVFALAYWAMVKVTPFSIRKEIEEDQNTALAIVIAAVIVGLALIISAALHG
jgi:putative membrane protein